VDYLILAGHDGDGAEAADGTPTAGSGFPRAGSMACGRGGGGISSVSDAARGGAIPASPSPDPAPTGGGGGASGGRGGGLPAAASAWGGGFLQCLASLGGQCDAMVVRPGPGVALRGCDGPVARCAAQRQRLPEEYLGPLSGFWWFNDTHLSS
jgi:hypothetical protein